MSPLEIANAAAPWVVTGLALLTAPSVLLQRQGRPTAALSWLLALFALPYLALPAWWLVGRTHLAARRRRRRHARAKFGATLAGSRKKARPTVPPGVLPVVELPPDMKASVFPASTNNSVRLLVDGSRTYQAWHEAIDAATDHLHLLFYIWNDDATGRSMLDALTRAAERGVEVRLLYDDVGTRGGKRMFAGLVRAGGRAVPFMPIRFGALGPAMNFRNHRKLIVVDGTRAFVGGINVGDEYLVWHDLAIELKGPVVDQAQEVFCDDWFFSTQQDLVGDHYFERWRDEPAESDAACALVASGPTERINSIREMVFVALTEARKRLWIMTPYLIPDAAMLLALRGARYRGVDVRILVPEKSDVWLVRRASRAFYAELNASGIRIFEYPGMVHAKALIVDDRLTAIGSANMDTRSLRLNFEVMCFLASNELNAELSAVCAADFARSREIDRATTRRHPWPSRVVDAAAHLLSPLL